MLMMMVIGHHRKCLCFQFAPKSFLRTTVDMDRCPSFKGGEESNRKPDEDENMCIED